MKPIKHALVLCALLMAAQAQALNILLTNDDGYEHPWIRAVHAALVDAGHQVTLVAPAVNQSGQSAAISLGALMGEGSMIDNPEPGIYAVKGTPATAVILGVAKVMEERPDLVVSGTNDGANLGVLSSVSGTVGATVAALNLLGEPIPAIAISSNRLNMEEDASSEANMAHARDVAAFLARLVAALEAARDEGAPLLPPAIALNVNYPSVAAGDIKGVGIFRHGRDTGIDFTVRKLVDVPATDMPVETDTGALRNGYIAIVPINGDYTAENWREVVPEEVVNSLQP